MSTHPGSKPGNSHPSPTSDSFAFVESPHVLTPSDLIELPRAGPGLVNPTGDLICVSLAQWSFATKKFTHSLSIYSLSTPSNGVKFSDPLNHGETFWLDERTLGQVATEPGKNVQSLFAISVQLTPTVASTFQTKIGELPCADGRDFVYSREAKTLVFASDVYSDTSLETVAAQDNAYAERGNSAYVYDETFVRHWDTWCGPKRTVIFTVSLEPPSGSPLEWTLGNKYTSPLQGTTHATPVYPFGGTDDFSVSATHVVYAARDPDLPKTFHTRRNVYIAPLDASELPHALTSYKQGETHSPAFSHDGKRVVWLQMDEDTNDADKLKVVIYDLEKKLRYYLAPEWDRSPDNAVWSKDDMFLYLTAHDLGRAKVFALAVPDTPSNLAMDEHVSATPVALTSDGFATAVQPLADGRLVFTKNTTSTPNEVFLLTPTSPGSLTLGQNKEERLTSFADAALKGKHTAPPEEMWFSGAEDRQVHSWVAFPPGYDKNSDKKYPVIMLVHGGAQMAWNDQWSTRFSVQVWAGQGYIVWIPNFTGSTGFGQEFVDAVAGDWGGAPFVDMRIGWGELLKQYPAVDPGRAAAIGGSWGGYGVNLIQGHPEWKFGFKALVSHCGEFNSTYSGYSVDEQTIFWHEWGGRPWQAIAKERVDRMSPHMFVEHWGTPQLWLHGSNDFRVSETQSIAAFHALQQKGVPGRLVVFPDENHFVLKPGNSLKWHYEVFRFLDQYVKNAK